MDALNSLSNFLKQNSNFIYSGFFLLSSLYYYKKKIKAKEIEDEEESIEEEPSEKQKNNDLEKLEEKLEKISMSISELMEKLQKLENYVPPKAENKKHNEDDNPPLLKKKKKSVKYYKLAFTGGPCAGRSTCVNHIADLLRERGFVTYIIPEPIALLESAGILMNFHKFGSMQILKFVVTTTKKQ